MNGTRLPGITRLGIFLLLLTPLVFWNSFFFPSISTKVFWLMGVAEMTFLCFLWLIHWYPSCRPVFHWRDIPFFLYVGIVVFTSLAGVYPLNSFWGGFERNVSVLLWLHLVSVFLVLMAVFRTERSWLHVCLVSTIVGLGVCFVQLLSLFGVNIFSIDTHGVSTLGNSSILGVYLLFQFFFSLLLFFRSHGRGLRLLGGSAFVIFFFTLLTTDARAVIIASVGGAVLFLSLLLLTEGKNACKKLCGGALLASLVILFFTSLILIFQPLGFFHELIVKEGDGSRFVVWGIAWQAIKERPVFGWGEGNFLYPFLSHYDPCFGTEFCGGNTLFDRAHNKILDVWVESGILGLTAYLLIVFGAVHSAWQAYKLHGINGKVFALFIAVFSAYVVQNLSSFDTAVSLLFFVIFVAFARAASTPDFLPGLDERSVHRQRPSALALVPALYTLLLPFVFFFFIIQPMQGALAVKKGVVTFNTEERFEAYERGVSLSPFGRDIRRAFLALETSRVLWSYRPEADAIAVDTLAPYLKKESALVESALQDTLAQSPNDFRSFQYLVMLLQAQGRLFDPSKFEDAERVLQEALVLNPNHPLFYWILTSVYLEQGKLTEASASMAMAEELSPDSEESLKKMNIFELYITDETLTEEKKYALLYEFYSE